MSEIFRLYSEIGTKKISSVKRTVIRGYPLHWHEYYEIEYIISGHGIYVINDVEYEFGPGTLFFMTPVDFTSMTDCGEKVQLLNISFSEYWIDRKLANELLSHAVLRGYKSSFCECLYDSVNSDLKFNTTYIRSLMNCLLIDIIRNTETQAHSESSDETSSVITDMIQYIQMYFRDDITLSSVAEYVGLSPNYASKLFHMRTGKTFKTYLVEQKLKYACALLSQTDNSVTDICYMCGFNSFAHFMRSFKQMYNTTPAKFRKEHPR